MKISKVYRVTLLLLGFCYILPNNSFAQNIRREFRNITVEDGLPHGTVSNLLQDKQGYVWIGTMDGLSKFDSHKFTTYKHNPKDSMSISSNQIFSLFEDSKGQLWIGTKSSLELYDRQHDNFVSFFFSNKHKNYLEERVPVTDIAQYSDSIYIIGTDGGGIYLFNPYKKGYLQIKKATFNNNPYEISRIFDICIDRNHRVWLASGDAGVAELVFETKQISLIPMLGDYNYEVRALLELSGDRILAGTYGKGVWEYKITDNIFNPASFMQPSNEKALKRIFSFCYDSLSGHVFIGTDGGGLFEYNPQNNSLELYEHLSYNPFSISNNAIKKILIDRENNLWAGHFRGGISFSDKRKPFHNIRYNLAMANSLSNNLVSSIVMSSCGDLLIGTDGGGLNILKPNGVLENFMTKNNHIVNQLASKSIISLYRDRNQMIWIGTYLDGVYQYSETTGRVKKFGGTVSGKQILSNDDIRCFYEDREGQMWIGTNGGGINIYDPQKDSITIIRRDEDNLDNSLSLDWILSILEDSYGYIWIGTAYGLNRYDHVQKKFLKFIHDASDTSSISNDFIFSIFEDSDKNLWIGTAAGLNLINRSNNKFTSFSMEDGLPDNLIYDIEEDQDKNLWIITNNGLSKFNLNARTFSNFDVDDGLLSNTFINGAMYKGKDNVLYVGSVKGLSYFNPQEIYQQIPDAPFLIKDFKIFNQEVPIDKLFNGKKILKKHITYTDEIKLSYKENVISFEYTALSFDSPNKIKYAYFLENFDETWNDAPEGIRKVTYTNLRPGDYVLRVKTTNLAHNLEKSVKLTVTPPFYQTIWFKTALFFLIVGIMYYWSHNWIVRFKDQKVALEVKIREEQLRHEKEEISLRNEKLKSEMNYKNAQLTSSTLLISHKNDIMREIKHKLTAFASQVKSEPLDRELQKLVGAIDEEFKVEEDWQRFEEHFNQIHKDFFKHLKEKYTGLSPTYLKLSAYIKMNLSSKEIASLMNISVRGVEKARSRLRKQLYVSQNESLTAFISEI